jgi:hypothetical protein
MSFFKSYFSKNNTIVSKDTVNTGQNPITEIFYGGSSNPCNFTGLSADTCNGSTGYSVNNKALYSRFLFDVNLDTILDKVNSGCVNLSGGTGATHTLQMTNTSSFDVGLLNDKLVTGVRRASSFSLILFKISGMTWDEGVGYDYSVTPAKFEPDYDTTYTERPSNWYSATSLNAWVNQGVYDNTDTSTFTLVDTQNFDQGNENISFNMTNDINDRLTGATPNTGITYGVAFTGTLENITGLTESYSVGFFTRHTQTFYEPYLETQYDDYIGDDRNRFYLDKTNRLFLYTNTLGVPTNLDNLPFVTIYDCDDVVYTSMTATNLTCGVYYVDFAITGSTYGTPSIFTDQWSNLVMSTNSLTNITNDFTVLAADDYYQMSPEDMVPKEYGYSVDGIKQDEKIAKGETRKVFVSVRVPYTVNQSVAIDGIEYRLYVAQGTTEVETQPWSKVNRTFNHNYFILNADDMIPNQYYIDIKVTSNQKVNIYKRITKFQVVNQL